MPGDFDATGAGSSGGDFNMDAAVSEIASGLGFEGDSDDSDRGSALDDAGAGDTDAGNRAGGAVEGTSDSTKSGEGNAAGDKSADGTSDVTRAAPSAVADLTQPPKTWRKEATADWQALPEHVRAEIHKREEDMFNGLAQYKDGAKFGWEVASMFKPYEQIMRQAGIAPQQILPGLINAHATLATGSAEQKLSLLGQMIKDYGIPVPSLLAQLTGGALDDTGPFVDPQVKALQDQLQSLQSRLSQQDRLALQARQAETRKTIEAFAADPANVYFEELADDIAALIRGGVTKDLKEAYEKALWANPVTREKENTRLAQAAESERARKAAEAAANARKATAANVRSTARSGGPTATKSTSLDETLERTLAEIQARSN